MGTQLSETLETYFSPLNSPDSLQNGIAFPGKISGQVRAFTESSPDSTDNTGNGNGEDRDEEARDDLGLNSLSAVRSFSTCAHWSQPWSIERELMPMEPKFYGGLDSEVSDLDWTDTWSAGNGSNHHWSVSVSGTSALDWKKWAPESTWESHPAVLGLSEWQSDIKEQEVELETISLVSSRAEWQKREEEEPATLEDKTLANSFFWDDLPLVVGGGLANLGNTCFLNAVLQCFMHTVPLVQSIQADNHPSPCDACNEGICVLCALKELMNISLASKGGTVHPWKIVNNLSYFSSSFQRFRQEDAHEFLQCFLDRLESCCNYPKLKGQVSSKHENVVKQTFGGHLISKLQCCNCGHCSDTYEPLIDLSLEIEDVGSLPMALDSFTKVEKIEDPETKFTCEKCKVQASIEKQLLLDEVPLVATFHLKRFKNDGSLVEKIDKHVSFPLELDLLPYVERNQKVIGESKYNLFAVVVHIGLSSCSGHYYCFVRASPNEWYKFDDSQVTQVQEDSVMSQEAYILFYVKQSTPWFSEFIETQKLIVDASISNSSPKSVLYNVDLISNLSPVMGSDHPCDVNEISNAADEASAKNFNGPKHNGIDESEGKENLDVVSAPAHEGASNSSGICSAETEKTPSLCVLKENNSKEEFGIAKRFANLTTETPSISPSPEIYREEPADNAYPNPCAQLRLADEASCKNQLQKHLESDPERKQACSLVKKHMPSSRGQQLITALRGSHSEGCTKKRRRRMEVSPIRDGSLSTRRRSNNSLRLRPLTASSLR